MKLNRERGEIEKPFKPVIRYAIPVFSLNGQRRGMVIANVAANRLVEIIQEANTIKNTEAFLLNQEGYYSNPM
ncbi:MAG: hypothetical protein ACOC0N_09470 [Chroococcales cyanobacterium]